MNIPEEQIEALRRIADNLSWCPNEHVLNRAEDDVEYERYWIVCGADGEVLGTPLQLPRTSRDASHDIRYFVSSTMREHEHQVIRSLATDLLKVIDS